MPLWKLTPVDLSDCHWEASTYKGEVIVREADERAARRRAHRAYLLRAVRVRAGVPKFSPWPDSSLVICTRVDATETLPETGERGVIYPDLAVALAREGERFVQGLLLPSSRAGRTEHPRNPRSTRRS
jgi:hypothetical protein